jgi:hypothetical protein
MNSFESFKWTNNFHNGLRSRMAREIIEQGYWAKLKPSSKEIYPSILKHVNKSGLAFPSIRTLAIISGVTEKTAGKGVKGLEGLPGFNKVRKMSRRGHTAYHYFIKEPTPDSKHTIWLSHSPDLHQSMSQLTPTAKAVLPVLKCFSYWEVDRYCKLEEIEYSPLEFTEIYKDRKYDFMKADESIICELAGISKKSLPDAYKSLVHHYFIEPLEFYEGRKVWKVFVKPTQHYKRDWLNSELKKRYS